MAPTKTPVIDAAGQPRRHSRHAHRRRRWDVTDIGKIGVLATRARVAIIRALANKALERLRTGKIKGRNFRVRPLGWPAGVDRAVASSRSPSARYRARANCAGW